MNFGTKKKIEGICGILEKQYEDIAFLLRKIETELEVDEKKYGEIYMNREFYCMNSALVNLEEAISNLNKSTLVGEKNNE